MRRNRTWLPSHDGELDAELLVAIDAILDGKFEAALALFVAHRSEAVRRLAPKIVECVRRPDYRFMYVVPFYHLAKWPLRFAELLLRGQDIRVDEMRHEVELRNGSVFRVRTSSEPDKLRGHRFDSIELDEAASLPWPTELLLR